MKLRSVENGIKKPSCQNTRGLEASQHPKAMTEIKNVSLTKNGNILKKVVSSGLRIAIMALCIVMMYCHIIKVAQAKYWKS